MPLKKKLKAIIIYFSLFVSLIMTIFSPIIIEIMYGKDFGNSIEILRLIVWFSTFSYLGTIRNVWITAEGKQKPDFRELAYFASLFVYRIR